MAKQDSCTSGLAEKMRHLIRSAKKNGSFRNTLGIFVPLKFSNIDIVEQMGYIYIYFYM